MRRGGGRGGPRFYLACFQASGVDIDGGKQVLEERCGQLQMLLPAKIVHHYQWCSLQSWSQYSFRLFRFFLCKDMTHLYSCNDVLTEPMANNGISKSITSATTMMRPAAEIQACSFGFGQLSHGLKQVHARLGSKGEGMRWV